MSFDNLNKLIGSIAKMVDNSEKIALPIITVRLQKMAELHPYDQTILAMANVISSLSEKKNFISRAELKNLYDKFYSRNTKFAEYFKDEIGEVNNLATPVFAPKNETPMVTDFGSVTDPVLVNALNAAFGNTAPLKTYSKEIEQKAKKVVASNLENWNLKASKLEVEAGNQHFMVVKADYDTPKGITSVLVPVEINKDKALDPSIFMANAGPQDLNHLNLKKYITSFAGSKLKVRANDIVDALTNATNGQTEISDAELALTKLNASKENIGDLNQVIGLTVENAPKNFEVNIPKLAEAESFAAKFNNPVGVANFKFGTDKINLGRDIIARELVGFGIKNPQITIFSCDDSSVCYAISVNGGRTAFKVPVKFANNRVMNPDVMICNGSVMAFNKQSINKLFVTEASDHKVAAVTSPQYALKSSELVENVRAAVDEGNYSKAEDALNVLQQQGDEVAYKAAFTAYMDGLSMRKSASSTESTCSMIVKNASSKHQVCGHTGLPLHKIYQDKHGNCLPLYRKGMEESYQGAFFMNSKIFG